MSTRDPEQDRIPVSPALDDVLTDIRAPVEEPVLGARVIYLTTLGVGIGLAAGMVAVILGGLIGLITNIAFYGRISTELSSPAGGHEGWWLLVIPSVGGLIVGLMARFGQRYLLYKQNVPRWLPRVRPWIPPWE